MCEKQVNLFSSILTNNKVSVIIDKMFTGFTVKKVIVDKVVSFFNYLCSKDDYVFEVNISDCSQLTDKQYIINFEYISSLSKNKNIKSFNKDLIPILLSAINI